MLIPLGYEKAMYDRTNGRVKKPIAVNLDTHAHTAVIANTGFGKTYLLKTTAAMASEAGAKIIIVDYKGDENLKFLEDAEAHSYYRYSDYSKGLDEFYLIFQDRLEGNPDRTPVILFADEYPSFLASCDKPVGEKHRKLMQQFLQMGRSLCCHVFLFMNRMDASYFGSGGARDSLTCVVGLGALSKESVNMAFPNDRDFIEPAGRGEGYVLMDGRPIKKIFVPSWLNMSKVEASILHGINREIKITG